ncbi:MAG TPA: phosphatase PAP2 family protein [Thermoanaerobaculia bacterium]|nr:phosphatase PAP2 family protein [Thermoanaerobaculia bacterium]
MKNIFLSAILILSTASSFAAEAESRSAGAAIKREASECVADAKGLALAPLHWNAEMWKRVAESAAVVGVVYASDRSLYNAVQRNRSQTTDDFAKAVTPFGGHRALQASVLMIGSGLLFRNTTLRDAGIDSLESELWAAGVVTPLIKRAVGRSRPIQEEGASSFHPFSGNHQSFPSGHSTNAFAFATAVAGHYDGWVVPTIVYTIASGVAFSRVNDRAHFPSDVVAGALIGHAVARSVVYRHRTTQRYAMSVSPLFGEHAVGLMFAVHTR